MKYLLFLMIIIFCFSCGNDDFPEQSELGDLRVLAISANTPEINAAATVTLTPLISYVNGGNTTLNISWEACPDPGIDFGADLNCDNAPSGLKLTGTNTFAMSTLSGTYYTGSAPTISLVIPSAAFTYLGTLDSDIQFNGLDLICFITYTDQNTGESIKVLKRVKLSTKAGGDLNTNPTLGNIQYNNSNLSAYPTTKGDMTVSSLSAPQSYQLQTNVGLKSFSEDMFVSWYASTGEYLFNRTDRDEKNTFTPSGSTGVFVVVYRDGRGGVTSSIESF